MAAFQQALANFNNSKNNEQNAPAASSSSLSIRGTAAGGAPSARGLASALRGAGITREQQMELDSASGGRVGRGAGRRTGGRSAGPLDQAGEGGLRRISRQRAIGTWASLALPLAGPAVVFDTAALSS
nr:uncharacterized protein CI109_004084 [Kwoniella shandongensis]KAA5527545.1 hypothetical protein CI109_004084 [Kwoniella shandongensis]